MALEAALSRSIRRVAEVFRAYAAAQGWGESDFKLYLRPVPEWGRLHVLLVARSFPGGDLDAHWNSVLDFLEAEMKDEEPLLDSINLVLRTFDQVREGGLYAIPRGFFEVDELFAGRLVDWPFPIEAAH